MRTLGIDFGEKRIGLAISNEAGTLAVPLETFERQTDRRAVYRIAALAREEGVQYLVLGEPRGLEDGLPGDAAERIRRFGNKLRKASRLPVVYVDEALTTVEATQRLREAGRDQRDRQELRDAVAAQILLQQALDEGSLESAASADARNHPREALSTFEEET